TRMRSRSVTPPSRRRHLSPPPMRRAWPPASTTPATLMGRPSCRVVLAARLAAEARALLLDAARVVVEDDALGAGEGDEAAAAGAADEGKPGLPREIDPPGGEA